jgi:hypothetical protein
VVIVALLAAFGMRPNAWSLDLYWAPDGDPGVAGGGTWGTDSPGWLPSATPGTPPRPWVDGSAAHFIGSGGGTVTLGSAITATNINFDPPAGIFTINTNVNVLSLQGTGIVNDSGRTQTINNNAGQNSGQTSFSVTSSAGTATITNNGGTVSTLVGTAVGGSTRFSNTSTARVDRPSRSKPISLDVPRCIS